MLNSEKKKQKVLSLVIKSCLIRKYQT